MKFYIYNRGEALAVSGTWNLLPTFTRCMSWNESPQAVLGSMPCPVDTMVRALFHNADIFFREHKTRKKIATKMQQRKPFKLLPDIYKYEVNLLRLKSYFKCPKFVACPVSLNCKADDEIKNLE